MESAYTSMLKFEGTILIPWATSCMRPAHPVRFNVVRSLGKPPGGSVLYSGGGNATKEQALRACTCLSCI